jgi:hypothetical protein
VCADSPNLLPFLRRRGDDRVDAPESRQKSACQHGGDPRHSGQHSLGSLLARDGLRHLRIRRTVDLAATSLATHCKPIQPQRRLLPVERPDEAYTLLHDGEAGAANGAASQRARFEVWALDQEIRPPTCSAKISELSPESPFRERQVQVGDLFPLDERSAPDFVVAGLESSHVNLGPEGFEPVGYPTRALVNVDTDERHRTEECVGGWRSAPDAVLVRSIVFSRSENT